MLGGRCPHLHTTTSKPVAEPATMQTSERGAMLCKQQRSRPANQPASQPPPPTHLEEVLCVQQARVDLGGRLVALADHKNLGRGVTGGRGLGGLNLGKELLEGVDQGGVILGPARGAQVGGYRLAGRSRGDGEEGW